MIKAKKFTIKTINKVYKNRFLKRLMFNENSSKQRSIRYYVPLLITSLSFFKQSKGIFLEMQLSDYQINCYNLWITKFIGYKTTDVQLNLVLLLWHVSTRYLSDFPEYRLKWKMNEYTFFKGDEYERNLFHRRYIYFFFHSAWPDFNNEWSDLNLEPASFFFTKQGKIVYKQCQIGQIILKLILNDSKYEK